MAAVAGRSTRSLDRMKWRADLMWWLAIALAGAWAVLWTNWWSLISAMTVMVAYFFVLNFTDYYRFRGNRTGPMPKAAKWFVILLIAHSAVGLVVSIYQHAV